jgi:hypothetical protein
MDGGAARRALEGAERGEASLDALLAVLEQGPALLGPPPESPKIYRTT